MLVAEANPILPTPQAPVPERTSWLIHVMPSLADVAFLIPMIFLFTKLDGARTMLGDGDTGWHIRTGEWILAHHRVPRVDIFSFTKPGQPWFAWEWLWDVTFAAIHKFSGLGGVVIGSLLILCLTIALLYKLILRRCGNPLLAITLAGLAAAGTSIHWLARPHLVSLLFMVLFLDILDRARDRRIRLLWLLPALMIPWTNLHGGFLAGIILVGAYAGGELAGALFAAGVEERRAAALASVPYLLTTAGCALATLVNPYGYHLHLHVLKYLSDPFLTQYVMEFQSISFRNGAAVFFEIMLALGVGAVAWYARRKRFTEIVLLAGWGHLGLVIVRNMPIFMIVAAPLVAEPLSEWLKALSDAPIAKWIRRGFTIPESIGAEIAPMENHWRLHAIPAAVMAALALAIASPAAGKKLKPEFDPGRFPAGALAILQQPGERVFTTDQWGDFLIYHLWPRGFKVYVDGRSDFYGSPFDLAYLDVLNVKYDWEQKLARYGINTILIQADSPLAGAVKQSSHWRVVYDDTKAIVFRQQQRMPGERVSTSSTGGGGRGPTITASNRVHPKDHVFQQWRNQ